MTLYIFHCSDRGKPILHIDLFPRPERDMKECSASTFSKEHSEKRATAFQAILDECSAFESWPVGIFNYLLRHKWFILSALFLLCLFCLFRFEYG